MIQIEYWNSVWNWYCFEVLKIMSSLTTCDIKTNKQTKTKNELGGKLESMLADCDEAKFQMFVEWGWKRSDLW